jgi:hypothetical protein
MIELLILIAAAGTLFCAAGLVADYVIADRLERLFDRREP